MFGMIVTVALAIMIFFAVKTRGKINKYGKMNINWEKEHVPVEGTANVEDWVSHIITCASRTINLGGSNLLHTLLTSI